ncbi:GerMN domain-containing protein [Microcoleus sp. FACHB-SPT15]|uniref:GerMN domain-containing protein n=1 Tax=Microcoleus sp. FACHB-SPT15 TaxID=2692830 RepID=UPI001782B342|nr:GerMN domain-containing protein [Microcoleus sp. FACHB-SPT15]MBD1806127.1 GerMN domain-containing protein [Microcoleus sp. FACHB-SPT15]
MQDQHQQEVRRVPLGLVAGLSAALLTAGGGAAWIAWNSFMSSQIPPAPTTPKSSQALQPTAEEKVQVYWLNDVNNRIEVVPSSIMLEKVDKPSEILEGAFKSLLSGPADPALTTTIPKGTELRGVALEADGVHVDLSKEFTAGGGSASMTGRVAQILYTASSLDPASKVWIEVEGKPLEVLGGEGIVLDQPLTRENFEEDFAL